MRSHKAILSVTLLVALFIALLFAEYAASLPGDPLPILLFGTVFLLFVLAIVTISVLFRLRDETHAMHEENRQQFHNLHERLKAGAVPEGKKRG